MDPELRTQLVKMLVGLSDYTSAAINWTGNQVPILIQEKITLGRVEETVLTLFSILGLLLGTTMLVKGARLLRINAGDGFAVALVMPGAAITLFSLFATFDNGHAALLAWFAPRLYIVDWLVELTKQVAGKG